MEYLLFQALQKLASQYLKRDWPGINPDDQRTDYRWAFESLLWILIAC